jgi:ParB family chromosome partitioning protein
MKKRNTLGKGLEALLGGVHLFENKTGIAMASHAGLAPTMELFEVDVAALEPGVYQPRNAIQEADILSLADSIKSQGILQPILVRKKGKDSYEILAGERRWRAAKLAGLKTVPVVEKEVPNEKAIVIALIENIQRENLSALEEAKAMDRLAREFDLTHHQVAEVLGKSRTSVTNALRLLTLSEEVKSLLEENRLEVGHAKALLSLKSPLQLETAKSIMHQGLSVRETEQLISKMMDIVQKRPKITTKLDPDVSRLQKALSEKLGASVQMLSGKNGSGRLVIHYNSLDELEGILAHIQS